ncbi:MAG: hypothetical protein MHM6MM_006290 [Cercozoa sp. M6MM]
MNPERYTVLCVLGSMQMFIASVLGIYLAVLWQKYELKKDFFLWSSLGYIPLLFISGFLHSFTRPSAFSKFSLALGLVELAFIYLPAFFVVRFILDSEFAAGVLALVVALFQLWGATMLIQRFIDRPRGGQPQVGLLVDYMNASPPPRYYVVPPLVPAEGESQSNRA